MDILINRRTKTPFLSATEVKGLIKVGSGVKNIFKYTPIYSKGGIPQLIEKDVFKIIIPLVPDTTQETAKKGSEKTAQKILELIRENPYITRKELAHEIGDITEDGVKYHLAKLKEKGKIKRVGPDKGGHWEILE